jgi:hypothetical protein
MEADSEPTGRGWQPRFGLGSLLLIMIVVGAMAASGNYFLRGIRGGRGAQVSFVLFTLAAPLLLVMLVSGVRALVAWWQRARPGAGSDRRLEP